MKDFIQFAVIGIGIGGAYVIFAQGIVLIYRGSGLVNFAQGALGMLSAFVTFKTLRYDNQVNLGIAIAVGILAAVAVAAVYQWLILGRLRHTAPIVRLISTLGLLAVLQAAVELQYGGTTIRVEQYLPNDPIEWGGIRFDESRLYIVGIAVAVTAALWAFTKFTRVGLVITASAENETTVQTLGWSPNALSGLTWVMGAAIAGLAGVIAAPLTGITDPTVFTLVVTLAALAAALLGGFQSFPLTLVGGMVVGIGESLMTLYKADIESFLGQSQITGLNRAFPFLVILVVLVVRGKGLPLRSHLADRLPRLGTGEVNPRAILLGAVVFLVLLLAVFDESWARASYISLTAGVIILSIVVLTGFAGQLSLAQWTLGGIGALIAAQLVRASDWSMEPAIVAGILLTVPVGMVFALPALRTRGVNLAVVTLGLGFTVSQVVFVNNQYIGDLLDAGTRIGPARLFGIEVNSLDHPHAWAVVCLVFFVALSLMVANLRRSRTGRRLLAVRTNERAAASLGISVFAVKVYAFGVAAGIAAAGGILLAFQYPLVTYGQFNVFESIDSVAQAVVGGLGYVIGAAFGAVLASGGVSTRLSEDLFSAGDWDRLVGGLMLFAILLAAPDGLSAVTSRLAHHSGMLRRLGLVRAPRASGPLPVAAVEPVPPAVLDVTGLTVRFGRVVAVDDVNLAVRPGEVVGLIGPNGAGKTTVIDAITGFVKPAAGQVELNGRSLRGVSATRRFRRGLARSFQSLELFDDLTVEQNIRVGADHTAPWWSWISDLFWPGSHPLSSAAVAAIRSFDMEDDLHRLPDELPYGRRRLVGITRAVAAGPSIIMLDEPAAGLDQIESEELAGLIRSLADERGMGVLLVEHDVGLVMSTCDRIVVVDFGRVIASGEPAAIRRDPAVVAAYLGAHDPADSGGVDASAVPRGLPAGVAEPEGVT
ncbi:MAG: ABC transporter [Acidimicrobiia bacterium]